MNVRAGAKITAVVLAVALAAAAAIMLTAGGIREVTADLLHPDDREITSRGELLYSQCCAACHGTDLEGQTVDWRTPGADGKLPAPPHDETGHTWHHPDVLLFDITKYGIAAAAQLDEYESAMPIYQGILQDHEIIAILSFIKSTWPEDVRDRHDELNRRYARKTLP